MIISASRRTDIPAFYSDWFIERIRKGYLYVRNPFNRKQVSDISLSKDVVDCIVFWTKNPTPLMNRLFALKGYLYYFQYTLNPYNRKIEKNVPDKEKGIDCFKRLSDEIGPDKVIWRYDPIFYYNEFSFDDHIKTFLEMNKVLEGYTDRCVISFLDVYKKCERNMKPIPFKTLDKVDMLKIARYFTEISNRHGIKIETCAEEIDLSNYGIRKGKCIDDVLISKISGKDLIVKKDKTQRDICGCVDSIDVGMYNTCKHNCLYCYANFDNNAVLKNTEKHDSKSPLICGNLNGDEKVTKRNMVSLFNIEPKISEQLSLF
jgi:DNA repair photolyase